MTQTVTKDGVTILVDLPENEKKEHRHVQPSYVKACQGDEGMASILDYFTYAASREIKDKGLSKDCKVVTLTRTHDEILDKLESAPSEKSLIRYLKKLKGCKFVLSEKYKRDFEVHLDTIQEAVNNPPPPKTRKPRQKGCKVEPLSTVQPSEEENEKVVTLQHKVDMLQQKVEQLQPFVDMLQRYNPVLDALVALLDEAKNETSLYITSILPLLTSNYVAANADNAATPSTFSLQANNEGMDIDDFADQVAIENWAKNFERACGPLLSQEPSPVSAASGVHLDNPPTAQPTDDTPSQARDNDGREAPVPLQAKSGTDLPTPILDRLSASTGDTPSQESRIANGTPTTDDGQTTLSRSGENATASNGVQTPPESGASVPSRRSRKKPEDETLKARVERVFAYFDKLKQETTGNPNERYAPTKAATREIKETLLPCAPTEQKLRKVYLKLWNTPRSRDGFLWKDHMTIKAVCGQYESITLALDAEENAEAEKKRTKQMLESVVKSPAVLVQAEDDYVFDLERVRGNRGRRSAS